jgi:hypothetical protein
MDKEKRIQEEVDMTLEIMDRMETLEAGPYFYTRLETKLRSREREKKYGWPQIAPLWDRGLKPLLLTLLILINVTSAVFFLVQSQSQYDRANQEQYQTDISAFIQDYSLDRNTYDIDVSEKMIAAGED